MNTSTAHKISVSKHGVNSHHHKRFSFFANQMAKIKAFQIVRSVRKGIKEVELMREGKLPKQSLDEFLNEL